MSRKLATASVAVLAAGAVACVHQTRVSNAAAPAAPTIWQRQVQNAKDAGDGDYQLRTLRARVAADPNNIAVRIELAKAYQERGYAEIALEVCRLAAARFPESGDAEPALMRSLHAVHLRDEAIQSLGAFLEQRPQTSPDFASWLGILHDENGHWSEGEPWHRKALALAPAQESLHNNLGYNLMMQHKNDDAAVEFREALKINPQSQVVRNNLGMALAQQNAGKEAVASFQSAADAATAHNNLAAVWMEKGNYAEARKELDLALKYKPNFVPALKNLELISRLDGKPFTLQAKNSDSSWGRWKRGFKKLFVGPLDDTPKAAPKPAVPGEN